MAWPGLIDCHKWNKHECRALHQAFSAMQGWITQYQTTGQMPSYTAAGCAKSTWDYYRKWCASYYGKFAAEVARLEAEKDRVRVEAAAQAAASKLTEEGAAEVLQQMLPAQRRAPLVAPDPPKPGAAPVGLAGLPWGIILAGGAGVLLLSRFMVRGRRQAG